MNRSMTLALSVAAVLGVNNLYADTIFCVHDKDLNDSQFCAGGNFAENEPTPALHKMGPLHKDCDIEALDVIYDPGNIYAASGDDTPRPGHLYRVNRVNGKIWIAPNWVNTVVSLTIDDLGGVYYYNDEIPKQMVKLREIDGISADPDDGVLWGWAQGQGLFKIAAAPLIPGYDADAIPFVQENVGDCTEPTDNFAVEAEMILPTSAPMEIEDIEWNEDGEVLYGVENVHTDPVDSHGKDESGPFGSPEPEGRDYELGVKLWAYHQTTDTITYVCTLLDLSSVIPSLSTISTTPPAAPPPDVIGEIEGLDSLPRSFFNQAPGTDTLLLTFHGSNTLPFIIIKTPGAADPAGDCDILYAGESIAAGSGGKYDPLPAPAVGKYELIPGDYNFNDIEGIAYGPTVAFF